MITLVNERLVYANRYVRIYDDDVAFVDGADGTYLRIVHAGEGQPVVVLPVSAAGVATVRVYRYPLGEWQWGLPRGFAQGRDVLETAQRELREELGVRAERLTVIGELTPDSGLLTTKVAVVQADMATGDLNPLDDREVAGACWTSLPDLLGRMNAGELQDAFTLSAILLALGRGTLTWPTGAVA